MMLTGHVIVSGVTTIAVAAVTKSTPASIACFLGGIFIDLDHLLDFFIIQRKMCWSYKELKDFCLDPRGKIYLVLHSYELFVLLWASVFYFGCPAVWFGTVFGMTVHLLIDQVVNTIHPMSYFLFYRARLGFPKIIFFYDRAAKNPID